MTPIQFADARRELGLTQQKLGEELGLSRRSIGAMERGEWTIARTTELSMRYLLLNHRSGSLNQGKE